MHLLFAWPAAAQEQRGSIDGVVKDSSGGVLPGVTVEAHSSGSGVLTTTSDATGTYRFPSVLPGVYEITANLASFKPSKVSNVDRPAWLDQDGRLLAVARERDRGRDGDR